MVQKTVVSFCFVSMQIYSVSTFLMGHIRSRLVQLSDNANKAFTKEEYPDPRTKEGSILCNRNTSYPSYVCDPGIFLTVEEANSLDLTLKSWLKVAECECSDCPALMGPFSLMMIAIVPKMKVPGYNLTNPTKIEQAIRDFSAHLQDVWAGQCRDNIVVVLSMGDRALWTAVGMTAQQKLRLECVDEIFSENKHIYAKGEFYSGLNNTVSSYMETIRGNRHTEKCKPPKGKSNWWQWLLIASVIFICVLLLIEYVSRKIFNRPLCPCCCKPTDPIAPPQSPSYEGDLDGSIHVHSHYHHSLRPSPNQLSFYSDSSISREPSRESSPSQGFHYIVKDTIEEETESQLAALSRSSRPSDFATEPTQAGAKGDTHSFIPPTHAEGNKNSFASAKILTTFICSGYCSGNSFDASNRSRKDFKQSTSSQISHTSGDCRNKTIKTDTDISSQAHSSNVPSHIQEASISPLLQSSERSSIHTCSYGRRSRRCSKVSPVSLNDI